MRRVIKIFFIGSAVFLGAVTVFLAGVSLTVIRGFGTNLELLPATCWAANILVVNETGQDVDSLVIRSGGKVCWYGPVAQTEGGCVLRPLLSPEPVSVDATLYDGSQFTRTIGSGFAEDSISLVHLLLFEPSGIRYIVYRGAPNAPVGTWYVDRFASNLLQNIRIWIRRWRHPE
jgi:hypothetical protein